MRKNSWGTIALAAAVAGMMTFSGCGAAAKSTSSNTSAPSPESSAAPAKPDFPKKEVTLIVPYPAGGGTDMVGRALAKSAEKYLGKTVIVVNKTGGGGLVGYTEGSSVKPDGYTVTFLTPDITMLPHMVDTPISYKNFKPLAQVNNDTAAITVRADAKWQSLKEFIDDAKANPGTIKMGHGGVGTVWHLVMASIEKETGAKFNQVPFESGGATVPALLGGHIDAVPISYAEVKANVDSGKLRTLALVDSKIADGVPKLKTLEEELGIKAEITGAWRGLAVPKDTPDDIAKILGDAFSKAVGDTEFKEFMLKNGLGIEYKDAKGFEALLEENHNAFGKIIPELGLKK